MSAARTEDRTAGAEDRTVRVALLGCGTVGSQVVRLLREHADDLAARSGARLDLVGIAVRDTAADREPWVPRELLSDDAQGLVRRADVVIELVGGIEPARTLVLAALGAGASVVTGNKALLAAHGPELHAAAEASGADLYYEAAVAGAVPVVYALRESMAGDNVTAVLGIVNGTTNFILDEMATRGLGFDEALALAQELGYAEADPTADVDGHDAAAKAAILASLAFHTRVGIDDVPVAGIRSVTAQDMAEARDAGYVIKLLAVARRVGDDGARGISVRVHPALLPATHPLAAVRGAFNAVVVESEAAGRLMFYGQGAGGAPTASAVMGDVVAAAAHRVGGGNAPRESVYAQLPLLAPEQTPARTQVQLLLADQPGTLAAVAGIYGANGVSIESVRQSRPAEGESQARITIVSHEANEAALARTVEQLAEEPRVREVLSVMRVEGE
ncbi:homoserine dehydrogenase [Georgenia muralis]|uniref:Homoserine dehydrogenase n=1 Tax=Georgenia muralis TaxID=154117 RepID=A0A3N4YZE3_9MICO|nr:homoserine dehydrogenase [Georgenia muralis]RPF25803.1 homoserine dehydrogenase [Georgenia muralis]